MIIEWKPELGERVTLSNGMSVIFSNGGRWLYDLVPTFIPPPEHDTTGFAKACLDEVAPPGGPVVGDIAHNAATGVDWVFTTDFTWKELPKSSVPLTDAQLEAAARDMLGWHKVPYEKRGPQFRQWAYEDDLINMEKRIREHERMVVAIANARAAK